MHHQAWAGETGDQSACQNRLQIAFKETQWYLNYSSMVDMALINTIKAII